MDVTVVACLYCSIHMEDELLVDELLLLKCYIAIFITLNFFYQNFYMHIQTCGCDGGDHDLEQSVPGDPAERHREKPQRW